MEICESCGLSVAVADDDASCECHKIDIPIVVYRALRSYIERSASDDDATLINAWLETTKVGS